MGTSQVRVGASREASRDPTNNRQPSTTILLNPKELQALKVIFVWCEIDVYL